MAAENHHAFFQGRIVPIGEARVSIMTSALNYGTAIFEGIRAYWNADEDQLYVFRLREHFERLLHNCQILFIQLPYGLDRLCELALELLRREGYRTDSYVRPLAYKSAEEVGVRLNEMASDLSMFAVPFGEHMDRPRGARLMVTSWRRIPDNSTPARGKIAGAYVNSALAKTDATLKGFDDALMLAADGQVSEASAANLFIAREGRLITPPVTADILEGITRATLIRVARDLGIEVVEREMDRSELYVADDAFLVGTAVSVVPVIEVDNRPVGDGTPGRLATQLRETYLRIVRGQEPRYRDWCTPVY